MNPSADSGVDHGKSGMQRENAVVVVVLPSSIALFRSNNKEPWRILATNTRPAAVLDAGNID